MKAKLSTLCTIAFILTPITTLKAEEFDVYIVAGQSNCDGRGPVSGLTGELEKWRKPHDDVKIAYSCSSLRGPILKSEGFQPLQPGWSVAPGKNRPTQLPSNTFGPELSFGRTMADRAGKRKIVLIKYTEGGTSLAKDWNPDVPDRMYAGFLPFVRQSLKAIDETDGKYTIRGMIWHQGESDANLSQAEYEKLLSAFIDRVRKDLVEDQLPFVVGEVYDNGKRDSIRLAQKAVSDSMNKVGFVPSAGLKTYDQGTHFDAASQIELGIRFAKVMTELQKTTQP